MKDEPKNIGASVRARLLNISRHSGMDYQLILTRYVLERLLYRLSVSSHKNEFVLKGAMLNAVWLADPFRNTQDLDLHARTAKDAEQVATVFQEIFATTVSDDGVVFDAGKLKAEPIRENVSYGGIRILTHAILGGARVPVRIDVGFGDAITPTPTIAEYPTLLDLPKPSLMIYPRETVVAEKFEAMVALGLTNSRMKDFHDIAVLATFFEFDGALLTKALVATFQRRRTALPKEAPPALTAVFLDRAETKSLWKAFVVREAIQERFADLDEIASLLRSFLLPPTLAASREESFEQFWPQCGPWK